MSLTADDRHDLTIAFASTMQLTGAFPLQATGQLSAGKFKWFLSSADCPLWNVPVLRVLLLIVAF
ncbi:MULTISPECIES: hypothetical protein [Paenibacillus]|jgi:hypothetical protein|uniref:hypothetical protein n=1 Tax=Paenibacillus TaxID=44249 RepID=UPI0011A07B2D|nr:MULTISPECIES: hypothetical protein [unclassified Paenibacillus]MBY0165273.1 hypothetical protein [Cytobacillus firmus]